MIIDLCLALVILLVLYLCFWRKKGFSYSAKRAFFYVIIVFMLSFTVMPVGIYNGKLNFDCFDTVNLIPYRDVTSHYLGAVRESIANVFLFVPFGIMIPAFFSKGFIKTVLFAATFSLFIESYQLLGVFLCFAETRTFDITDIINNTIGSVLGFLIYLAVEICIDKKKCK